MKTTRICAGCDEPTPVANLNIIKTPGRNASVCPSCAEALAAVIRERDELLDHNAAQAEIIARQQRIIKRGFKL